MDFFLDRKLQTALQDKLSGVPDLVEELAITITRQARIQKNSLGGGRKPKPESRVPFHIAAAQAADELHNCLVTWVRLTCEERQVYYKESNDDITLSRWLRKHMISLALTPGSEEAFAEIAHHIDECRRLIDLPPDDEVFIDRARVESANRQVLTAGQVEKIAGKLGALGTGLNKRRVETLAKHGLRHCDSDGEVKFYRLGDVLDAHHGHAQRRRKAS